MNDAVLGFSQGVLRAELLLGVVSGVSASGATVNLVAAGHPTGSHFETVRYGRGEVGEMVLIEGQVDLVLARLIDVRLPEGERRALGAAGASPAGASGALQFLGTVRPDALGVSAGVATYPRLGDRVYAAPHELVGRIPELMAEGGGRGRVVLDLGTVSGRDSARVSVRPEKLFGRHCAILGATGGGKSWTVARLVEEATRLGGRALLIDATGEYAPLDVLDGVTGVVMGNTCSMPAQSFQESDFLAMFQPSARTQAPKLRDAIRSLRLVARDPTLGDAQGIFVKAGQPRSIWEDAHKAHYEAIENPETPFNVGSLAKQLGQECVFPDDKRNPANWGARNDTEYGFCLSLMARIAMLVRSKAFAPVFQPPGGARPVEVLIDEFLQARDATVLRLDMGRVRHEFGVRELITNAVGRGLLRRARAGDLRGHPLVVIVDEAHNFLGRSVGDDDASVRLDAFELIAREGRKYGLNLCLATQRPRDLTESVLSQMGTLIVHRLTNDRDREIVERACGEIDRAATAFLANLRQGEAAIVGVDFPIPLTVQIGRPTHPPASDGPDYQAAWSSAGAT